MINELDFISQSQLYKIESPGLAVYMETEQF